MVPPYCCSLINTNESNISFCYLFCCFVFFFSCCQIYQGLDSCNSWLARMDEGPRATDEHLFLSSAVVVGHNVKCNFKLLPCFITNFLLQSPPGTTKDKSLAWRVIRSLKPFHPNKVVVHGGEWDEWKGI